MTPNKTILILLLLVTANSLQAQNDDWQFFLTVGQFTINDEVLQNDYGNGLAVNGAVSRCLGAKSRLKLFVSRFQKDGDPYSLDENFNAGNAGSLALTQLGMTLENASRGTEYPRLWFGVGVYSVFVSEKIVGNNQMNGDDIGAHFTVTPEFRILDSILLVFSGGYRISALTLRDKRNFRQLDLSGASLSIGFSWIH